MSNEEGEPIHIVTESREEYEKRMEKEALENYKEGISFLEIVAVLIIILGIILLNPSTNLIPLGVILIIAGLVLLYSRYKKARERLKAIRRLSVTEPNYTSNGWEQINEPPSWVYGKMKRKQTNRVNGNHFVYKKENGKFYRKLK